jgi:hypothetical protein
MNMETISGSTIKSFAGTGHQDDNERGDRGIAVIRH